MHGTTIKMYKLVVFDGTCSPLLYVKTLRDDQYKKKHKYIHKYMLYFKELEGQISGLGN
jgi:hypothetical protein